MKIAALLSENFIHHLDHLATASYYFDCPLYLDSKDLLILAKRYYPMCDIQEMPKNISTLAKEYDTFILSTKHAGKELSLTFQMMGHSEKRFCYLPHGHSDKGLVNPNMLSIINQDIVLLYGTKQINRVSEVNAFIVIGNLRYALYQKYKVHFDSLIQLEKYFPKKQTTALYAPTWDDTEHGTSFLNFTKELLHELPSTTNLIVKPHPFLERDHPATYYYLEGLIDKKQNAHMLIECPLIYPLLAKIDLYIGDYSALNYDQLYFPIPAYFAVKEETEVHVSGVKVASAQQIFINPQKPNLKEKERLRTQAFSLIDPQTLKQKLQESINAAPLQRRY